MVLRPAVRVSPGNLLEIQIIGLLPTLFAIYVINDILGAIDIVSKWRILYLIITHSGYFQFFTILIDAKAKYLF